MTVNKIWGVIPAGGSGQRMQASVPKQYLRIHDKVILEHTLAIFLNRTDIESIVVCVAPDDDVWPTLTSASAASVIHASGGETRAKSVLNGLNALSSLADDNDWVLVHDAARPCLSDVVLQKLIDELGDDAVGGILAVPAKDTLKRCVDDSCFENSAETASSAAPRIQKTLDRSVVWQAQTPQMFRYKLLKNALRDALALNIDITDESSALEWAGFSPRLVEGDARNLKVTTPEDLALATFLLRQEPTA